MLSSTTIYPGFLETRDDGYDATSKGMEYGVGDTPI
jgi:hypothetical protein